jgi:hypothetical protein
MSNDIVMQINVRKTSKPPYFDFDIDKYPADDKLMISLMVLVKMGLEKTINQFSPHEVKQN